MKNIRLTDEDFGTLLLMMGMAVGAHMRTSKIGEDIPQSFKEVTDWILLQGGEGRLYWHNRVSLEKKKFGELAPPGYEFVHESEIDEEESETGADGYLNYPEASEFLNIPRGTLYSMVSRNEIPHIRLSGRSVRFSKEKLNKWLDSKRVEPKEPDGSPQRKRDGDS